MKKFFLLIFVSVQVSIAQLLSASYEVSFGMFQTMGIADASFEIKEDQTYTIRIEARTTGIAKVLSNNRIEMYESKGIVQNGKLIPEKFVKIRQTNSTKTVKIYTFDHEQNTVWFEKIVDNQREAKEKNDFYASEDILTLFFNIKNYMKIRKNRVFHTVGSGRKDGRIDVVFPQKSELEEMKKTLKMKDGDFIKVILNDRIFSSANGELLINLNQEGLCEKAILEDVLLFGDIVGKKVD